MLFCYTTCCCSQDSPRHLYGKRRDQRTRRNRVQLLVNAFKPQMEAIADAYLAWDLRSSVEGLGTLLDPPADAMVQRTFPAVVVDLFSARVVEIPLLAGDAFVSSGLVNLGYFPCAADSPLVVITTRVLEVFRVTRLRCPRLAIQPFVKSLCDIHGVPFRPYLSTQFSIAFDLYLATLAIINKRVQFVLGRDSPNWRLQNACPACFYKLEGEAPLHMPVLACQDGNNSLKRFGRRDRQEDGTAGASKERQDTRQVPGDYYLEPEEVDSWGKDQLDELMKGFTADPEWNEEDDGCSDRWQNMKEQVTAKAWGMYEETGLFLSLCRHGFVLMVCDMIRSGELAKYGYAINSHLITVLGELSVGYDIGCKFDKMMQAHPILGKLARDNNFKSLVGAFHGHGHCRLCQLSHLATYVKGVGLDDLEYCETFFSKSNALAASTRCATRFHLKQAIATYLQHTDVFDTYQSLSLLLSNKYKRALEVKSTVPALTEAMRELGVQDKSTFEDWLAAEKACLLSLTREPIEETLDMEYYQKLVNLAAQTHILAVEISPPTDPSAANYEEEAKTTRRLEAQRRHAMEMYERILLSVQDLEARMSIEPRWLPGSEEWKAAAILVARRRYQRALDQLQGLIIARMFELTKMNMSGTGYKLRKHIAKALQARSSAVKTALKNYNLAGARLRPPRAAMTWEQVVDYAFLSDFDLLRDGREDIREQPWAKPSGRIAMDMYFKIERAGEEIERLNLEIPRFLTYMRDEEDFLRRQERRVRQEHGTALAHQVHRYRMRQGRFNDDHRERLFKLARVPGFSASMQTGTPVNKDRLPGADEEVPSPRSASPLRPASPGADEPPESDSDSDDEADVLAEEYVLLSVMEDSNGEQEDTEAVVQEVSRDD
ncbi:hypothetical protein DFH09DRAFT_901956 [Mycena vulgaris]|nr:hypothetical protein DFH09DRAFT_901956 [Mycena vulgaris]